MSVNLSEVVKQLSQEIPAKCGRHDRMCGSVSDHMSAEYIKDSFAKLGVDAKLQAIRFMGWDSDHAPVFRVTSPESREIRCSIMHWSGATPEEGVEGTLEYVGPTSIIRGLFYWDKYIVVDKEGQELGQVIGISSDHWPHSLPEPLEQADYPLPSVIIGNDDNQELKKIMKNGNPRVYLKTNAVFDQNAKTYNVIGEVKGSEKPDDVIIVSCHYDSIPCSPGASDNASGVACMLKLAEMIRKEGHSKTVRFVAFGGEEWNNLGARYYVRHLKERGELGKIVADLEIDTVCHPEGETLFLYCQQQDKQLIRHRTSQALEATGLKDNYSISLVDPSGGLDSWDFHLEGIPTLTAVWWPFLRMHYNYAREHIRDTECKEELMQVVVDVWKAVLDTFKQK